MRKFIKVLLLAVMIVIVLFSFSSCKKKPNLIFKRYLFLYSREEAMRTFGYDALYPPEGFGNNRYTLLYTNMYHEEYIKDEFCSYSIRNIDDDEKISFICDIFKNPMPDYDYPKFYIPGERYMYMEEIYIEELPVYIYCDSQENILRCLFHHNGYNYDIRYENYSVSIEDLPASKPIEFIEEMLNASNNS